MDKLEALFWRFRRHAFGGRLPGLGVSIAFFPFRWEIGLQRNTHSVKILHVGPLAFRIYYSIH